MKEPLAPALRALPASTMAKRNSNETRPRIDLVDDALCRLLMQRAEDALFKPDTFDALITDPPAGITFMGRAWDGDRGGRDQWIAWLAALLRPTLTALKPGAYAFVWALPRTSHWTATAIEDAGFEICDVHHHIFGTGFPKHASKLKPAIEHWILARKPAKKPTLLNINECRIGTDEVQGRWPPNLSLDESAAAPLDEQSGETGCHSRSAKAPRKRATTGAALAPDQGRLYSDSGGASRFFYVAKPSIAEKNLGLPDDIRNTHETVKSVALMRWLVRLVTPPGGVVLDLFAGSGTTGVAALAEGRSFVGIEQDERYATIAAARLRHALTAISMSPTILPLETKGRRLVSAMGAPQQRRLFK